MACETSSLPVHNTSTLYNKVTPALELVNKINQFGAAAVGTIIPGSGPIVKAMADLQYKVFQIYRSLVGADWKYSKGVRWMLCYYQQYVLGQCNVTSDNKVNENYINDASAWFMLISGVPIYDQYRMHTLWGTSATDGHNYNHTDDEKVAEFLRYGDVAAAGVTYEQAYVAVQVFKKLLPPNICGDWASMPVVESWFKNDPNLLGASDAVKSYMEQQLDCYAQKFGGPVELWYHKVADFMKAVFASPKYIFLFFMALIGIMIVLMKPFK